MQPTRPPKSGCGSCRKSPTRRPRLTKSRYGSGLTQPGEYGLFTILREYSANKDESYLSDSARRMIGALA